MFSHALAGKFDRSPEELQRAFPSAGKVSPLGQMLLQSFVRDKPQKFFDRDAYSATAALLARVTSAHAAAIPTPLIEELTEALRFLRRVNHTARDATSQFDRHDEARAHRLRTEVFSEYASLSEHVLGSFLALLVELAAKLSGRVCTVPHELRGRWDMAKSKRSMLDAHLTDSYNPTIRNAIIHGGATITDFGVTFEDDNGARENLSIDKAERLATRLLDTCNGVYAALVESLANDLPMTLRLPTWSCAERVVAFATTALLVPDAVYVTDTGNGTRAEIHGSQRYWRHEHLLIDMARAAVILKMVFPDARSYHLSFRSPEGAPTFFQISADRVPALDADVSALDNLFRAFTDGQHGLLWLEQHRVLPGLVRGTKLGLGLNWMDVVDRGIGATDYELRELKNISVQWRSRFEAKIISAPRPSDLDENGKPKFHYLQALFTETFIRWMLRPWRKRILGTWRFRVFELAVLNVYCSDRRIAELSGLGENLMFRFQLGARTGPGLWGSQWERIGVFHVVMNVAGHEMLRRLKESAG